MKYGVSKTPSLPAITAPVSVPLLAFLSVARICGTDTPRVGHSRGNPVCTWVSIVLMCCYSKGGDLVVLTKASLLCGTQIGVLGKMFVIGGDADT